MKQRKTSLDLIGWDGESDGGNDKEKGRGNNDTSTLDDNDPSSDSDCPVPLPNFKGIKISPSDIPKLRYNSTVAQYNNWLVDLKTAFNGDPAKFSTSRQKIILASITLDEQLKTVTGASIVVIGLTGGSLGSCHGETVQMYIVAIMIEIEVCPPLSSSGPPI